MKYLIFTFIVLCVSITQAQVGIGTASPTAELEINAPTAGWPVIEINPQTAPTGTATGQLSVIGDKLYMYDAPRGKWLSIEYTLLNYGLAGGSDNQELEFAGDVEQSGPRMPFDGTIVYATMNASGGQANKTIQIYKNNIPIPNNVDASQDGVLQLSGYTFTNTTYNYDFAAGDFFRVVVLNAGGSVQNLSLLLKVKWRK